MKQTLETASSSLSGSNHEAQVQTRLSDGYGNGCGHHHTLPEEADGPEKINDFVSYRGIENPYGRAKQWLDGVNVYLLNVYASNNPADWQQRRTDKYRWLGMLPPTHTFTTGGAPVAYHLFQRDLNPGIGLVPSSCEQGSATTFLADGLETCKPDPAPDQWWDGWSILDEAAWRDWGSAMGSGVVISPVIRATTAMWAGGCANRRFEIQQQEKSGR